jgi:hypothetical protein
LDRFIRELLERYRDISSQRAKALRSILLCRVLRAVKDNGESLRSLFEDGQQQFSFQMNIPTRKFVKAIQTVLNIQIKEGIIDGILLRCLSTDLLRVRVSYMELAEEVASMEALLLSFRQKVGV